MNKRDWALTAISLGKGNGLTPAQLQKVLFLLGKAYPKTLTSFYSFTPYNYGPFDKTIYQDANELAEEGLIQLIENGSNTWSYFCITKSGKERVRTFDESEYGGAFGYLKKLVEWAQNLTFEQLISSVYDKYPEYKVNSVFRG